MEVTVSKTLATGPTATLLRLQLEGDFLKLENVPSGNTLNVKTSEGETFIGSTGRSVKFEKQFKYLEISGYVAGETLTFQTGYGWMLDSVSEVEVSAIIPNPLPVSLTTSCATPVYIAGCAAATPVPVTETNSAETLAQCSDTFGSNTLLTISQVGSLGVYITNIKLTVTADSYNATATTPTNNNYMTIDVNGAPAFETPYFYIPLATPTNATGLAIDMNIPFPDFKPFKIAQGPLTSDIIVNGHGNSFLTGSANIVVQITISYALM